MEAESEQTESQACSDKCAIYGTPAHPEGLKPDPGKIEVIFAMPELEDATALKRFLGMVNYLSKFMLHLSKMTEPLRRLEDKDMEWQ